MAKKIPSSITILGRKYKVKQVPVEKTVEVAGQACEACVDLRTKTIYIVKTLSEEDKLVALFHEVSHIGHYVSGVSQVVSPEMQEILCETSAQSFLDLMRSM